MFQSQFDLTVEIVVDVSMSVIAAAAAVAVANMAWCCVRSIMD